MYEKVSHKKKMGIRINKYVKKWSRWT
jgi:hypothetical protein